MIWSSLPIKKITKGQKNYPRFFLALENPPESIYYRGSLAIINKGRSIAIVGSRKMTRYGAQVIDQFVAAFVSEGIATISGFMYGVDTEVHRKTVEYGGITVAVMGGGIDEPYPADNNDLYTDIVQKNGAVISEYEPKSKPKLWMYPQRNRIVASLATLGVLVIEAGEESGSLITVEYAKKLNKNIFAIPGPITSAVSRGTNMLIKKGIAKIVTKPEDIIGVSQKPDVKTQERMNNLNSIEKKIYFLLKNDEMTIDEIAVKLRENAAVVSAMVSMLSLRGLVSEAGGRYFVV